VNACLLSCGLFLKDEDYEVSAESAQRPRGPYVQKSSYDLTAACLRQASFYYNVSLPHYKDSGFIDNAVLRYKKFLYLRKIHPDQFIVPFYDVDLVWHTHQLHPVAYEADMTLYLGSLFNHDDTDTDRSPSSKLTTSGEKTRKLWRTEFGEEFALTGAIYRGPSPVGRLAAMRAEQVWNADLAVLFTVRRALGFTPLEQVTERHASQFNFCSIQLKLLINLFILVRRGKR